MSAMPAPEAYFDEGLAARAVNFIERVLVHTVGHYAGKPFILEPWQRDEIIRPLFGWLRPDGSRLYKLAYISMARKNGKSELGAAIALYLTFADGEYGAHSFSAASDRRQASVVFDVAAEMVLASPVLRRRAQVYKAAKRIVDKVTHSTYEALSADAGTKHGLNASGVVFDELHTQPNRALWDVLQTSRGTRKQALMVALTTAGYDRQSICYEMYSYAKAVRAGVKKDPTFFSFIREAKQDADWTDEAVWRTANPALGTFLSEETMREECERAKQLPAFQNTFRNLYLNQWVQQRTRAIDMHRWDKCRLEPWPNMEGAECFGGLDLSESQDLTAFVRVFPRDGEYLVVPHFWLPADDVRGRSRRDGVDYETWAREGLLTLCEGAAVDYMQVVADIGVMAEKSKIRQIAFDRWGTLGVYQALEREGFPMVRFGQGFADMSGATKEFLSSVAVGKLRHDGNPILQWNVDCLELLSDPAGNVKPVKPDRRRNSQRIDGVVAAIMALKLAMVQPPEPVRGPYLLVM